MQELLLSTALFFCSDSTNWFEKMYIGKQALMLYYIELLQSKLLILMHWVCFFICICYSLLFIFVLLLWAT